MSLGPIDQMYTAVAVFLVPMQPNTEKSSSGTEGEINFGGPGEASFDSVELSDEAKNKKTELEAKKKEEEEKKKLYQEIQKICKEISELNARLQNISEGDDKKSISAEIAQLESQVQDLKSRLNGDGNKSGTNDSSKQAASLNPTDDREQYLENYKQDKLSNLQNHAPMAQYSAPSSGRSGATNPFAQGGSYAPSASGSNGGSYSAPKASVASASNPSSKTAGNKASTNNVSDKSCNAVLSKAKDSNQSWGDYWKEAGYNEKVGSEFAKKASKTGGARGTSGKCARGVSESYKAYFGVEMHGNGRDWDENMRTQKNFKEISTAGLSKSDLQDMLKNLPAGAVVCWESQDQNGDGKLSTSGHGISGSGEYYGHVTIADGNGGEYSDHHAKNIYTSRLRYNDFSNDKCAIFIPV